MNKKPSIYFVEPFMTGSQHAAFNSAMLAVLLESYPNEHIVVQGSPAHFREMMAYFKQWDERVSLRPRKIVPNRTGNKWVWLKKLGNECLQLSRVLRMAQKDKPKLIYIAFLSPVGQYLLNLLLPLFRHLPTVLVTLHGLDLLKEEKQRKGIDRLYAMLLKKAFLRKRPNKRYLILEQQAKRYLLAHQYLKAEELFYIPHPYHFPSQPVINALPASPLVFGHLGVARLDKQSQLFFALAEHFKEAVQRGLMVFRVIGTVLPEMQPYLHPWVEYTSDENMLSAEAYAKQCKSIHYAVFCYPPDAYTLTSSGALLDAIAYQKPILALRTHAFQQLFELAKTPPGELFDHFDQLIAAVGDLLQNHAVRYPRYFSAFVDLQRHYSITHVAEEFKQLVFINNG